MRGRETGTIGIQSVISMRSEAAWRTQHQYCQLEMRKLTYDKPCRVGWRKNPSTHNDIEIANPPPTAIAFCDRFPGVGGQATIRRVPAYAL